jgi:hypothetical protein
MPDNNFYTAHRCSISGQAAALFCPYHLPKSADVVGASTETPPPSPDRDTQTVAVDAYRSPIRIHQQHHHLERKRPLSPSERSRPEGIRLANTHGKNGFSSDL